MSELAAWLSHVNPNTVIAIASAIGTWLWHHASSSSRATATKIVDAVIDNFVLELLGREPADNVPIDDYIKRARAFIERQVWDVLAKRGVPKNATTSALVSAAIERGTAELRREILSRRDTRHPGVTVRT